MADIYNDFVKVKAEELLKRAILPEDGVKAEYQKNIYLQELSKMSYAWGEKGITVTDEHGLAITDAHGWDITLNEFLQNTFNKYFEVSNLPISEEECLARLRDPKITPKERKKVTEIWDKLKK